LSLLRRILNAAAHLRDDTRVQSVFAALGFAVFYAFWIIKPAVESKQAAIYHWSNPAQNFFVPFTLDFLAVWFVLFLLLLAARSPGRRRVAIWGGLLFFTPWFIDLTLHILEFIPATHQLDRALFLGACVATLWPIVRWRQAYAKRFDSIIESVTTILIFTGFFGAFMLCQLAFRGWQARWFMGKSQPLHHTQTATTIQPHRIIWVVLDELSYEQTYEHRFPGLKLPAFDALAANATVFTHAEPFDIHTEIVLPGLFAGKPFDNTRSTPTAALSVHNPLTGKWQAFQQHDTIFQDALNDGYSTAVVGWYNPYCRLVPEVVDSCYWAYRYPSNFMLSSNTMLTNILAPFKLFAGWALGAAPGPVYFYLTDHLHIPGRSTIVRQPQIDDYLDLDAHSTELLRDRSYGFVLLHLPVPHPWGIYNRYTGQLTSAGPSSYVNNLALADKCFAGIRQTLEQTGQWDSSTVVIMGDHSWRTKQDWKRWRLWSQEDELASHGGQYDPRPAYIVKLPGQTTGTRIDTPYRTVNTRTLFDAIMAHRIDTSAELSAWVQSLATHPGLTAQTP
jgi:hypothetical protein